MAASPRTPNSAQVSEGDENVGRVLRTESLKLEELRESRAELQARVQSLKKDLQEWRGKLDNQVKNYRQELGDLKNSLNMEVEQLQSEFQDLRMSIRKQLDATTNLSTLMQEKLVSPRLGTAKTAAMTSPKKTLISLDGLPSSPNQTMSVKFSSPLPKMQEKLVSSRPDTAKTVTMTSPKKTLISLDGLPSSPNQILCESKVLCESNAESD